MGDYKREQTQRAFAFELLDSTVSLKPNDQPKAPSFLLTPTGGLFNRVMLCGTVLDKEEVEGKSTFWRAQITDRTDTISITAGEYNEQAMIDIFGLEPPEYVAVIGKPNLYERDGKIYISIRAESVRRVSESEVKNWILDTANATMDRLEALLEGTDENARKAMVTYDVTKDDINTYRGQILGVLATLLPKESREVKSEPLEIVDLRPKASS